MSWISNVELLQMKVTGIEKRGPCKKTRSRWGVSVVPHEPLLQFHQRYSRWKDISTNEKFWPYPTPTEPSTEYKLLVGKYLCSHRIQRWRWHHHQASKHQKNYPRPKGLMLTPPLQSRRERWSFRILKQNSSIIIVYCFSPFFLPWVQRVQ